MTSFNYYKDKYDIENHLKEKNTTTIGSIEFLLNKSNYDNYKRTYKTFQSLLAEIMSVISLY